MRILASRDLSRQAQRTCAVDGKARSGSGHPVPHKPDATAAPDADGLTVLLDPAEGATGLLSVMIAQARLRVMVGRPSGTPRDQTCPLARLRDLLSPVFPALGRRIGVNTKTGLTVPGLLASLHELGGARPASVVKKILRAASLACGMAQMVEEALARAKAQTVQVSGASTRARKTWNRIGRGIAAPPARHRDAALILSLRWVGTVMSTEHIAAFHGFLATEALAAAACLEPGLHQLEKPRAIRRVTGANNRVGALERLFFRLAFTVLSCPESAAFHDRKRVDRRKYKQSAIALARIRRAVVRASGTTRQPFRADFKLAA